MAAQSLTRFVGQASTSRKMQAEEWSLPRTAADWEVMAIRSQFNLAGLLVAIGQVAFEEQRLRDYYFATARLSDIVSQLAMQIGSLRHIEQERLQDRLADLDNEVELLRILDTPLNG